MKTSKEVREIIADKVRENIINGVYVYEDIQYKSARGNWMDEDGDLNFEYEYRVKPETITINGVEISKPIDYKDMDNFQSYYIPANNSYRFSITKGHEHKDSNDYLYPYKTKEEAIEASKALFGIKE